MPASVAALGLVTRLWGWEGQAAQKPVLCFLLCVFLEVFFQGRNETENIQDASHTLGHKKLTHLVDGSPAPVSWKQPWALETQRFLGDDGWLGGPAGRAHCPRTPWSLPALGPPSTGPCSPIRTKDAALQRRSAHTCPAGGAQYQSEHHSASIPRSADCGIHLLGFPFSQGLEFCEYLSH